MKVRTEEAKQDKNKNEGERDRFLVLLWHLIPFHFRVIPARRVLINRDFPLRTGALILFFRPRSFQLLEYQWPEGEFKQTSSELLTLPISF